MIYKVNEFHAASDEGFDLFAEGRDVWIYSEDKRQIYVTREAAKFNGTWGEYVYLNDIPQQWMPPFNWKAIPETKRQEIANNIRRCLEVLGVMFKIG
jgi:hypothetical protein